MWLTLGHTLECAWQPVNRLAYVAIFWQLAWHKLCKLGVCRGQIYYTSPVTPKIWDRAKLSMGHNNENIMLLWYLLHAQLSNSSLEWFNVKHHIAICTHRNTVCRYRRFCFALICFGLLWIPKAFMWYIQQYPQDCSMDTETIYLMPVIMTLKRLWLWSAISWPQQNTTKPRQCA